MNAILDYNSRVRAKGDSLDALELRLAVKIWRDEAKNREARG
jgi:hypothetical protein